MNMCTALENNNKQDISIPPPSQLADIYADSKEFLTVKQHLDQKLQAAINEPIGESPQFATNFLWQVSIRENLCAIDAYFKYKNSFS